MKFSPTLPRTETLHVQDYTHTATRDTGVMKGHGYFTCKARRAIFIKFSRINKLAFVGHAFLGLILIGFYLLIERFIILSNSACQALFGI